MSKRERVTFKTQYGKHSFLAKVKKGAIIGETLHDKQRREIREQDAKVFEKDFMKKPKLVEKHSCSCGYLQIVGKLPKSYIGMKCPRCGDVL